MIAASEEITKTWVRRKGLLIANRPRPSHFSFAVCLAIVISLTLGFIGGFLVAGFALQDNYSSVYESLLAELEIARTCFEREREEFRENLASQGLIKDKEYNK